MLNELHDLAQSLKAVDVSMASWHMHFKTCPKGTATFFVLLDSVKQVTDLEPITDRERLASIRKWEVAAGTSFPAFNVLPLYEPTGEEAKKMAVELRKAITSKSPPKPDEIKQRLESLVAASISLWVKKEPARITKCLTTLASEVGSALGASPDDFRSIAELISRSGKLTAESLFRQLASVLANRIVGAPNLAADWFDALIFHSGKTAKAKQFAVVLELADRSQFPYPAVHERVQSWMNQQFQGNAAKQPTLKRSRNDTVKPMLPDAYAGSGERLKDKFPSVTLPIVGPVILRSMHKESRCQYRYGVVESLSFPVGRATRQEMKDALEWLGNSGRQDRTWADARGMCGYTKRDGKKVPIAGLLFAYPAQMPEIVPELAGLIVGLDSAANPDGARFEACAARVTGALSLKMSESSDTEIRVFALKKADKARTKLIQSRSISASHLVESAKAWQHAARNTPPILIRQFGAQKGDKPFWAEPFIPFPAEVVSCLNTAWERAGTHAEQVSGFNISDGLDLLLEGGVVLKAISTRAIRTLATNSLSLVLAMGQAHRQGLVHSIGRNRLPAVTQVA